MYSRRPQNLLRRRRRVAVGCLHLVPGIGRRTHRQQLVHLGRRERRPGVLPVGIGDAQSRHCGHVHGVGTACPKSSPSSWSPRWRPIPTSTFRASTVAEADGVDEAASVGVVGEGAASDEAAGTTATANGTRTMAMTENTAASGWMVTSLDAGVGSDSRAGTMGRTARPMSATIGPLLGSVPPNVSSSPNPSPVIQYPRARPMPSTDEDLRPP